MSTAIVIHFACIIYFEILGYVCVCSTVSLLPPSSPYTVHFCVGPIAWFTGPGELTARWLLFGYS